MITKKLFVVLAATIPAAFSTDAWTKSKIITLNAASVVSQEAEDRGSLHVFEFGIPEDVVGKRLDSVILEFQIDVGLAREERPDATPVIAVYPLNESLRPGQSPVFTSTFASARNVMPEGVQTLLVDITEIVRGWVQEPSSNHGLVIGSFTGAKLSKLDLKPDAIDTGKMARVTFFYQNRFGDRLSDRQD